MTHFYPFTIQRQLKRLFAALVFIVCFSPLYAQLEGVYTIGGSAPDYPTINAAVAELTAEGVSGAVTFNLRTGTYIEQVELGAITGASTTNTITFRAESGEAADVVISYAAVSSADNYVIQLKGASHYRIQNLTISAKGTAYNRAITVFEQVNDLLIDGSLLSAPRYAPFRSGQAVLYLEPSLASEIRIRGNHITGGIIGVSFRGTSDARPTGTVIADNVVEEFTSLGVSLISLQGGSLTGNRIISTFSDNDVSVLDIRDWDGTAATPVLVANNFISVPKFQVGAYILNVDNLQFLHNSVYGGKSSALELHNSRNIGVKNNIFRTDGNSAVFVTGTAPLDMDYNDLSASGGFVGIWERENATNLARWRNISGQGAHSISFDPQFLSTTDLHAQAPALAGAGVAIPQVTVDIDGEPRDATPSIGADEYSAAEVMPLSGTYTLGGSGADYTTFHAAVAAMEVNGISGAVVFEVAAGNYTEQVVIPNISGGSVTNTVTFQSATGEAADVMLTHAATGVDDNYVIQLKSTSHIRLLDLTLKATGTTYTRVLEIIGWADDLLVEHNRLLGPSLSSISPNQAVLYVNSWPAKDLRIRSNQIAGGSYGAYFLGLSYLEITGVNFTDNVVENFSYYGVHMTYLSGGSLTGNKIISSSTNNDLYGIHLKFWDGTQVAPVLVANNFVSVPKGQQGVYIANADYLQFVYNSVYVGGGGGTAFYLDHIFNVADRNLEVRNNLFRAGTGLAARVELGNTTSLDMDHNDLFNDGNYLGSWEGTDVTSLNSWQSISGKGLNSISFDPQFISTKDLHAQASELANAGVAIPEVTVDIDGEQRDATPSIGADEFEATSVALWLEAECADYGSSWQVGTDATAAGGTYLVVKQQNALAAPPADVPANLIRFPLDRLSLRAGEPLYLYARIDAPSRADDSFWVRLNGGEWYLWKLPIPQGKGYQWYRFPVALTGATADGNNALEFTYREDGTRLDRIYVSTIDGLPATAPAVGDNCAPRPESIALEAECADRGQGWLARSATTASNNQYLVFFGQRHLTPPTSEEGKTLDFSVDILTAGEYFLFGRVDAPDRGRNSFWVSVDGSPWVKWWQEIGGAQLLTDGFAWREVNDDGRAVAFDLTPGAHTIRIANREPGTRLDKLQLSLRHALPTGFGAVAAGCSSAAVVGSPVTAAAPAVEKIETDALGIYPNPTAGRLRVEWMGDYVGPVRMTVFDMAGRRVQTTVLPKAAQHFSSELDVSGLPTGNYRLQLVAGAGREVRAFTKR